MLFFKKWALELYGNEFWCIYIRNCINEYDQSELFK